MYISTARDAYTYLYVRLMSEEVFAYVREDIDNL